MVEQFTRLLSYVPHGFPHIAEVTLIYHKQNLQAKQDLSLQSGKRLPRSSTDLFFP